MITFKIYKLKLKKKKNSSDNTKCCEIVKEGLRDTVATLINNASDKSKIYTDFLKLSNAWKAVKNKCNHCLKITKQTLDILIRYGE